MPFLNLIDKLYDIEREKLSIPMQNKEFCIYIPVKILDGERSFSYVIRKEKKSKILITSGKQRVYLSDHNIICTILSMPSNEIEWFLSQFVSLYKEKGHSVKISIADREFSYVGITNFPKQQELTLFSDTVIDYSYFCFLLNFIFAKDECWEKIGETPRYSKMTLCKYISIIDYFYSKSQHSKTFLESIGYPIGSPRPIDSSKVQETFKEINCLEKFDIFGYMW